MADTINCCARGKLTSQELRDSFLFGLDIGNTETGEMMSDDQLLTFIDIAYSYLEELYDIVILPRKIEAEPQDYYQDPAFRSYWQISTEKVPILWDNKDRKRYPIQISAYFGANLKTMEFPEDWLRVNATTGTISIFPTVGSMGTFLHQFSALQVAQGAMLNEFVPQYYMIDYWAGMCPIPRYINSLVGKLASLYVLNVIGDIGRGAGLASYSLSIDGLSQSLSTTNSATSSQYGARVTQYKEELKRELELVRSKFGGLLIAGA